MGSKSRQREERASEGDDIVGKVPGQLPGTGYGGIRLDKLTIEAGVPLPQLFGVRDPCPGQPKTLRVRYEIVPPHDEHAGSKAERRVALDERGCLMEPFRIEVPEERPLVRVIKATYGHPLGSRRGRGAFEVTESLQGRIDVTGGQFLAMDHSEDLKALFGDPAKGMRKVLADPNYTSNRPTIRPTIRFAVGVSNVKI